MMAHHPLKTRQEKFQEAWALRRTLKIQDSLQRSAQVLPQTRPWKKHKGGIFLQRGQQPSVPSAVLASGKFLNLSVHHVLIYKGNHNDIRQAVRFRESEWLALKRPEQHPAHGGLCVCCCHRSNAPSSVSSIDTLTKDPLLLPTTYIAIIYLYASLSPPLSPRLSPSSSLSCELPKGRTGLIYYLACTWCGCSCPIIVWLWFPFYSFNKIKSTKAKTFLTTSNNLLLCFKDWNLIFFFFFVCWKGL